LAADGQRHRRDTMTAPTTITLGMRVQAAVQRRPSFWGMLRGEIFKVSRQRATWAMAAVLLAILVFPYFVLITLQNPNLRTQAQQAPLQFLYSLMGNNLLVLRVFSGPFLIIVTARLIGMEYSGGTIRVLLARGVGRLQLIAVKLLTAGLVA